MLRLFFECWAMFAVYHCVSIAQFLLSSATSRMLAMLNDCSRVKWYVFFFMYGELSLLRVSCCD